MKVFIIALLALSLFSCSDSPMEIKAGNCYQHRDDDTIAKVTQVKIALYGGMPETEIKYNFTKDYGLGISDVENVRDNESFVLRYKKEIPCTKYNEIEQSQQIRDLKSLKEELQYLIKDLDKQKCTCKLKK